jgi:hypothetical protein
VLRLALLASLTVALLAAPADAEAKVRCGSGTTLFVQGKVRIFGVHYATRDESGYDEYACARRSGRPLFLGGTGSTTGTGSADTPVYAIGGGRYIGAYHVTDGEGGPDAWYTVDDVKTRKTVIFANSVFDDEIVPQIRVAADGSLLAVGEQVTLRRHHPRRTRVLSTPGVLATDLALAGDVAYWTEHPDGGPAVVRSFTLSGVPAGGEGRPLEPIRPRLHGGACRVARGHTLAASPSVRVYRRAGTRFACRVGRAGRVRLAGGAPPVITADRWLLAGGSVWDMRTRKRMISASGVERATQLRDGTLAWIDPAGGVLVQRPGQLAPTVLADGGASALASSRRVVYWTAAGTPHGERPPRGL